MYTLMFIFFFGAATGVRVYDLNTHLVPNNNYGVDNVGVERRSSDHRHTFDNRQFVNSDVINNGPNYDNRPLNNPDEIRNGPNYNNRPLVNPDVIRNGPNYDNRQFVNLRNGPNYDRIVETNRPRHEYRHPGRNNQPKHSEFADKSNEITDENIERIRTNIYSNVQPDQRSYDVITMKTNKQNDFGRRSDDNHLRQNVDSKSVYQNVEPTEATANKFYTNGVNNEKNIEHKTVNFSPTQSSETSRGYEATEKTTINEKPITNKYKSSDGTGSIEESTWVWGTSDNANEITTPDDLNNRASFKGDDCASGKIKVNGKCVDTH